MRIRYLTKVFGSTLRTGLQRVNFNQRFAVVIEDVDIRDKLAKSGLNINGKHIFFGHHRRRIYVDPTRSFQTYGDTRSPGYLCFWEVTSIVLKV